MTFHVNRYATINQIAELAGLAKNTAFANRVGELFAGRLCLVEDRQRDAFMFQTSAVCRDTSTQNHYLLYFMQHWFDIRSKDIFSTEVSFYKFPTGMDANRKWIEQCFGQAARIYGWNEAGGDTTPIFDPVFCADDWSGPCW